MISLQHKPKRNNKPVLIILIFALLALIFILLKSRALQGPLSGFVARFNFGRAALSRDRELTMLSERLEALEKENEYLRAASGENSDGIVRAEIRLGGGYLFSDILIINKGKSDGIEAGDIVFSKDMIFMGKISETGANWSRVHPVGRLGDVLSLRAGAEKEIPFEAVGAGRGEMLAQMPKETGINVGDVVWLGEGILYPAGVVSDIKKSEGREIQDVRIVSPLPLSSIAEVVVLKNR